MSNAVINEYLDLLVGRHPGEGVEVAVARILQADPSKLTSMTSLLSSLRSGDGLTACKVFLLTGARVRHVCASCHSTVSGTIVRHGVKLDNGVFRDSLERGKRAAIALLKCDCRKGRGRMAFWGRPVLEFWEVEYRGKWVRLSFFRMPWD